MFDADPHQNPASIDIQTKSWEQVYLLMPPKYKVGNRVWSLWPIDVSLHTINIITILRHVFEV